MLPKNSSASFSGRRALPRRGVSRLRSNTPDTGRIRRLLSARICRRPLAVRNAHMVDSYLLFFFAGLGAFNGLVLAGYLFWRRASGPGHVWLAALVLVLSVRTGKSVLFYFWPEIPLTILQIGLTACFLIGPCLLGYLRALWPEDCLAQTRLDQNGPAVRYDARWAGGLLLAAVLFGLIWPYVLYEALWRGPVVVFIQYWWLGWLLLAGAQLYRVRRAESAGTDPRRMFGRVVTGGVALIWLAYFSSGLTSYIVGALSFSLVLYLSIALLFRQRQAGPAPQPYQERRIATDEAQAELAALHALMTRDQLHRDATLTLTKLARRMGVSHTRLSQLLNDNNGTSFRHYVNQHRIDAAKALLRGQPALAMEDIAEQAGFVSMSTFYAAFKKATGMTPASWRQSAPEMPAETAPATPET